ncbi:hypothetical protein [Salinisphaera aquimarina]|uniref:EF-hand domain-containing protein n=1 Tax=Salinisphaera aquimarina TaxID=2094031 RepID=A0ABV7EIN1_9GAMM
MFKKTAIALGLVMAAGTGMAAQTHSGVDAGTSASANVAGQSVNTSASTALRTQFSALDTDGNGMLSRSEAAQSPQLSKMYDSLDTSQTIEGGAQSGGLTLDQLQAGLQAQASGSGAVGPAVSGGETYTLMKDGSKKLKSTTSGATGAVGGAMSSMQNKSRSTTHGAMSDGASMRDGMKSRTSNGAAKARTMGSDAYDGTSGAASSMQQRGQSMQDGAMQKSGAMHDKARTMGSDAYDGASGAMDQSGGANVNVESKTKVKSNY